MDENVEKVEHTEERNHISAEREGKEYIFSFPKNETTGMLKDVLQALRDHVITEEFKYLLDQTNQEGEEQKSQTLTLVLLKKESYGIYAKR